MTVINSFDGRYDFSFVDTMEELEAIFAGAAREITGCVVHHTHTFKDQILSSDDIHRQAVARGYRDGIPYHFIIQQNGSLQRGLPMDFIGDHAGQGYNKHSIGIAFVGGLNLFSTNQQLYGGFDAIISSVRYNTGNSFSIHQWKTFNLFCKTIYSTYPFIQMFGHNEITTAEVLDPGFNVASYIKSKYGKVNVVQPGQGFGTLDQTIAAARV